MIMNVRKTSANAPQQILVKHKRNHWKMTAKITSLNSDVRLFTFHFRYSVGGFYDIIFSPFKFQKIFTVIIKYLETLRCFLKEFDLAGLNQAQQKL